MPTDPHRRRTASPPAVEHLHNLWLAGLGAIAMLQRRARTLFAALVEEGRTVQARRRRDGDR